MGARCPGARYVGAAVLPAHLFRINGNHHATILPAAGKVVHGVVWSITVAHEAALDVYEGVAIALYRRHQVLVTLDGGEVIQALTYMARNTTPTPTSGEYFDELLAAARSRGLPEEYLLELEEWRSPVR